MTYLQVQVGDERFRAELNEHAAPQTCAAVLDTLPFEGRAVHVQVSGEMFRMLDHAPLPELAVEGNSTFQHPGSVIYYPPSQEIALCYGQARFAGHTGPIEVTPFAEVEGDPSRLRVVGERLSLSGVLPIRFSLAADQDSPFVQPRPAGRSVRFGYGIASTSAALLDAVSPQTCAALGQQLPLETSFVADMWGGQSAHASLTGGPGPGDEATSRIMWPGYVYYSPDRRELTFCYGNAVLNGPRANSPLVPVLALGPEWHDTVLPAALGHLTEGRRTATVSAG